MRPFPLTALKGGINRLRVKGGATADTLYDLQNAYITNASTIAPREGTIRAATLNSSTVGLMSANGSFNIFSSAYSTATLPTGYVLNVLSDPNDRSQPVSKIWYAKPFMGFPFVVAEFANGDIWHYWLQNNGTWTSSTDYTTSSIVLPPTPNGIAYQGLRDFPANPLWTPETAIALNAFVEPTTPTGFAYKAVSISGAASNAALMVHADGANGSTTILDSSVNNFTLTASGATIDTSEPKFGTGALNLSASTAYFVSCPMTTGGALDLGAGDFTAEFWFNRTTADNVNHQLIGDHHNPPQWNVQWVASGAGPGQIRFTVEDSVPSQQTCIAPAVAFTPTIGTWHACAVVRAGTAINVYIDGVAGTPGTIAAGALSTSSGTLRIGASANGNAFPGELDEIRITKGIALYTANYTPATAAFVTTPLVPGHTGASEPIWPTVAGGTLQEFGDFDVSATDAGTTQANNGQLSTATPLGNNITDRYGNSSTIANAGIFTTSSVNFSNLPTASTKVTTWKAGTNYAPGAVVIPTTNQGAFTDAIPNGDFEGGSGVGGWTFTDPGGLTQWDYSTALPYQGTTCITFPGGGAATPGAGGALATMTSYSLVTPGQSVTATCYVNPNNAGAALTLGIQLNWYDANDSILSSSGHAQNEQEGGGYRQTSVTAIAPIGAAHVRVSIFAGSNTTSRNAGFADLVSWNLETPAAVTNFLFEAVQPTGGSSSGTEPTWPTVLGSTVIDGSVTWEAIGTSVIVWEAIPLLQSGLNAPTFPTTIGNSVLDSSTFTDVNGAVIKTDMSWVAVDRHIADQKDPNTKAVVIGASHVFAGDNDIVDYSAAVDPTDWTSTNNAGYLPTGLNSYGDNPVTALALYRGNLIAFNASGYQMWQIDPDPQNMAFLDAQPVGSIYPRGAQSVANDLLFLTEVGVRNLGTIGATANMAIGNTGQPVDPLIKAQLQAGAYDPLSLYYPGRGQYWLIFGPQAFVLTINGNSTKSWARYVFPYVITDWTLNAGVLYLRMANNLVWQLDANTIGVDDSNSVIASATNIPFNGVVQWPYLDMGSLGLNKMLVGVDIVGSGSCSVQVAFNQADKSTFNDNAGFSVSTGVTTPYLVAADDTLPGEPLPIPVNAPSYSLILTFTGSSSTANAWGLDAANLYVTDAGGGGSTG